MQIWQNLTSYFTCFCDFLALNTLRSKKVIHWSVKTYFLASYYKISTIVIVSFSIYNCFTIKKDRFEIVQFWPYFASFLTRFCHFLALNTLRSKKVIHWSVKTYFVASYYKILTIVNVSLSIYNCFIIKKDRFEIVQFWPYFASIFTRFCQFLALNTFRSKKVINWSDKTYFLASYFKFWTIGHILFWIYGYFYIKR